MMAQTQSETAQTFADTTPSDRATGQDSAEPMPLGAPHDGIAAVLTALSWAAFLYFAGMYWQAGETGTWTGFVLAVLAVVGSQAYFCRAHFGTWTLKHLKLGLFGWIALGAVFMIMLPWVMPAFYAGVDGQMVVYVLGCLAIPTLIMTPTQMLLRANARKARQLEELGVNPR